MQLIRRPPDWVGRSAGSALGTTRSPSKFGGSSTTITVGHALRTTWWGMRGHFDVEFQRAGGGSWITLCEDERVSDRVAREIAT
jgi:hypothetical protein